MPIYLVKHDTGSGDWTIAADVVGCVPYVTPYVITLSDGTKQVRYGIERDSKEIAFHDAREIILASIKLWSL